jgi:hypothetical protein
MRSPTRPSDPPQLNVEQKLEPIRPEPDRGAASCVPTKTNIYQGDPQICSLQLRRRLDDGDRKRGSNVAAQKVTSPHAAVAKSEYSVEMQASLAVVSLRYVTKQTQYFALLIDGNRTVPLGSEVKPPDLGVFESPDRLDRCRITVTACSFAKAVIAARASSP